MKLHIVFLLLFLTACFRPKVEPVLSLPKATQKGANTFGFMLDEEVWVDYGKKCSGTMPCNYGEVRTLRYLNNGKPNFRFDAGLFTKEKTDYLDIEIENITQVGTYTLQDMHNYNYIYLNVWRHNTGYEAGLKTKKGFTFHITKLDTINKILSGTFEGELQEYNDSTKTKKVRDGRFDVTWLDR
jgi:hypothetical protein